MGLIGACGLVVRQSARKELISNTLGDLICIKHHYTLLTVYALYTSLVKSYPVLRGCEGDLSKHICVSAVRS